MAQTQIPMVRFTTEILQLQYIDKVIDVCCAGPQFLRSCGRQSRSHSCSSFLPWTKSLTCPLCSTTDAACQSAENCFGPAVAAHLTRLSMTLLVQFIDCSHVPVIMQRRCTVEVPQIQLSPVTADSSCATEKGTGLGGYGGDERVYRCWRGFFGGIDPFFRAPLVVPELSASFRALEHSHL